MNIVAITGRITKDPELRSVGESNSVVNFTLAVNRPYKTEAGETVADFIQCAAWDKQAQFLSKYVKKGQQLEVTGSIETRSYEDSTGATRYVTEVRVDRLSPIGSIEKKLDTVEAIDEEIKRVKAKMTEEYNTKTKGVSLASDKKKIQNQIAEDHKQELETLEKKKQALLIEQDPFKGEAPF